MMLKVFSVFLCVLFNTHNAASSLTSCCNAGDTSCMVNTITQIIQTKPNGDPSIHLQSINPIFIPHFNASFRNKQINGNMTFTNVTIWGLSSSKAIAVRGFGVNPEGTHVITLHSPYFYVRGHYTAVGVAFGFPVDGDGPFWTQYNDFTYNITIDAGSEIRNGSTYMDIHNVTVSASATSAAYNFENMKKGNPVLSTVFLLFFKLDWQALYAATTKEIFYAVSPYLGNVFSGVLKSIPYKHLTQVGCGVS